jgi:hypothetical protein
LGHPASVHAAIVLTAKHIGHRAGPGFRSQECDYPFIGDLEVDWP